jgi:hypothetical protein
MNRDPHDDDTQAASHGAEKNHPDAKKESADKVLQDPKTYEQYDEAMGELGDADGAASLGGPAA